MSARQGRLRTGRLRLLYAGLRRLELGFGDVQCGLADEALRAQFARALGIDPRVAELGFGLGQRSVGARQAGLCIAFVCNRSLRELESDNTAVAIS